MPSARMSHRLARTVLPPRIEAIIREVAAEREITREELLGPCRARQFARARQYAMWLCRNMPTKTGESPSLSLIGDWFSRDHTTVKHACDLMDAIEAERVVGKRVAA